MAKIQTKVDFRSHEHLLTSLGNPLEYRLLRTGTLCRNLSSQRLKALKHHSRASCPGPTGNCAQPVGFMSHRTLRLSSRSRSRCVMVESPQRHKHVPFVNIASLRSQSIKHCQWKHNLDYYGIVLAHLATGCGVKAKKSLGLDSDRWIPLRGGVRIQQGL